MNNYFNNQPTYFSYVNDKHELVAEYYGDKRIVGYEVGYVKELEKICLEHKAKKEEYYQMLVDNGILKKELTTDEKLDMLLQKIEKQDQLISEQNKVIEALQKDNKKSKNSDKEIIEFGGK